MSFDAIDFFRIAESRIADYWAVIDLAIIMRQLGVPTGIVRAK